MKSGIYTVRDILREANFDLLEKAESPYSKGVVDYRRVKIGGLPFSDLDDQIQIPDSAEEVVISVDGEEDSVIEIER